MNDQLRDIHIGKGLGNLRFGSTREQVQNLLGAPSETEQYSLSDEDDDRTEAWHYDELDLSLSFDEETGWRLSSIAISSDDYTLDGKALIGMDKEAILAELDKQSWGELEEDEEVSRDNKDNCLLHVDDASLSLWFEKDKLTELQIGPFRENGDIIWP